ncbi:MAG: ATP-binding cassette domain-containing protein [Clostridia bacterium]|nr:ATP-binding cassette domain-containing protein [Clostridia bacterium]
MIRLENISKTYKVYSREKGLWNSFKSVFRRKYKIIEALKDVSFTINEGEIVGYIGPNGAGKSTTIKIMTGIISPTSGNCLINGFNPSKDRQKYVRTIGAVFGQRSNLAWDVPVIDSFELLKDIYRVSDEEYEKNLKNLTQKLDLDGLLTRPLRSLSLGQRMRCEIAGALLHSPKILFLDEPTIGLDSISKIKVREFIKEMNKETKLTVILTTHDMNDIDALTNRIILIGKGQKLYDGSFEKIKEEYSKSVLVKVQMAEVYDKVEIKGYQTLSIDGTEVQLKNLPETTFSYVKLVQELEKNYKIVDISTTALELEEVIFNLYKEFKL